MNDVASMSFAGTHYEYEVTLGTVMDTDAIAWHGEYRCDDWDAVQRLIEVWQDSNTDAAFTVDVRYYGGQP